MKTMTGKIQNTGFHQTSGEVRKAVTRVHKPNDIGKTFTDNYGRSYVYTKNGLIY